MCIEDYFLIIRCFQRLQDHKGQLHPQYQHLHPENSRIQEPITGKYFDMHAWTRLEDGRQFRGHK